MIGFPLGCGRGGHGGSTKMTMARTFIVLTLLSVLSGCQAELDVPDQLVGTWKTAAPLYADRFLEIEKEALTFGTGDGSSDSYVIASVEKVNEDNNTLYTISYTNEEGQEYLLSFYHDPRKGGLIWFKHQDHLIWTKERG